MRSRPILVGFALCAAMASSPAAGAADGALGGTSSGSSALSVTTEPAVRISRLDDISLTVTPSDLVSGATVAEAFCVYDNTPTFRLTPVGSGTGGTFGVAQGAIQLAYTAVIQVGPASFPSLTANVAKMGLVSTATDIDCANSDNFTILLSFATPALQAAVAGLYVGTLTLTVAPN